MDFTTITRSLSNGLQPPEANIVNSSPPTLLFLDSYDIHDAGVNLIKRDNWSDGQFDHSETIAIAVSLGAIVLLGLASAIQLWRRGTREAEHDLEKLIQPGDEDSFSERPIHAVQSNDENTVHGQATEANRDIILMPDPFFIDENYPTRQPETKKALRGGTNHTKHRKSTSWTIDGNVISEGNTRDGIKAHGDDLKSKVVEARGNGRELTSGSRTKEDEEITSISGSSSPPEYSSQY